ncbi:DUF134 domain-containing protein [Candidatus Micrarchaeota archaeon]|nr:DUF134 domain-containing protein [Candidatus Micrarchaeota archaeon]
MAKPSDTNNKNKTQNLFIVSFFSPNFYISDMHVKIFKKFGYIFIMVRPRKSKRVHAEPEVTYFKPRGIPLRELEEVEITLGEFEAIRLNDLENMKQTEVAKEMGISQPTLHRLLQNAHEKIARALSEGKAIKIFGGTYEIRKR